MYLLVFLLLLRIIVSYRAYFKIIFPFCKPVNFYIESVCTVVGLNLGLASRHVAKNFVTRFAIALNVYGSKMNLIQKLRSYIWMK